LFLTDLRKLDLACNICDTLKKIDEKSKRHKTLRTLLVRLLLIVGTGEISNFDLVRDFREVFGS
jgi:hypothetical protein